MAPEFRNKSSVFFSLLCVWFSDWSAVNMAKSLLCCSNQDVYFLLDCSHYDFIHSRSELDGWMKQLPGHESLKQQHFSTSWSMPDRSTAVRWWNVRKRQPFLVSSSVQFDPKWWWMKICSIKVAVAAEVREFPRRKFQKLESGLYIGRRASTCQRNGFETLSEPPSFRPIPSRHFRFERNSSAKSHEDEFRFVLRDKGIKMRGLFDSWASPPPPTAKSGLSEEAKNAKDWDINFSGRLKTFQHEKGNFIHQHGRGGFFGGRRRAS